MPDYDQLDALGLPRPRLQYNFGDYVANGLATARRVVETVCRSMNCTEIHHREEPEGAGHILGTYRMGTNPADSVVDANQRTHDHPNLFLVGSGTFPTIGTANPTLALVALALRTADYIAQNFQPV